MDRVEVRGIVNNRIGIGGIVLIALIVVLLIWAF